MVFAIVYLIFAILFIAFVIFGFSQRKKNLQDLKDKGFSPNYQFLDLLIDEGNGLWCLKGMNCTLKLSDITDCEIIEDGISYKPDHGVLRAVVGGALFGGTGAIIGAMTSSTSESISRLEIVIHTSNPILMKAKVVLISTPTKRNSSLYQTSKRTAESIISCLDRLSGFSSRKIQQNPIAPAISDADELAKYKALLDNGAISKEEYDEVKKRILKL